MSLNKTSELFFLLYEKILLIENSPEVNGLQIFIFKFIMISRKSMSVGSGIKFSDLAVGEYFVVASPNVPNATFYPVQDGKLTIASAIFESVMLKTKVKSYALAPQHLLAVAERIRNYIAFNFQNPCPVLCTRGLHFVQTALLGEEGIAVGGLICLMVNKHPPPLRETS